MVDKKKKANNVGKRLPNKGSFKKGDPRCHRSGQISKKRLQFNKTLNELLVAEGEQKQKGTIGENTVNLKKVEWLVKSVWKNAINGESWAVNFIADRVEGKVTQPIDMKGKLDALIVSDKFLPKDENGSKPEQSA